RARRRAPSDAGLILEKGSGELTAVNDGAGGGTLLRALSQRAARPRPARPASQREAREAAGAERRRPQGACPPGPTTRTTLFPLEDLLGDDQPLDLRRPLVDLEDLRVAHQLLDRVLGGEAVASEHLHGVDSRLHRDVGREGLRHRGLACVALAAI